MVCKKKHAAKSITAQPMESLIRSGDSNQAPKAHEVEIIEEKEDRQKQDEKAKEEVEKLDSGVRNPLYHLCQKKGIQSNQLLDHFSQSHQRRKGLKG